MSSEDAVGRSPTDGDRERDKRMDDTTMAIHRVHESHSALCQASGRQSCRVRSRRVNVEGQAHMFTAANPRQQATQARQGRPLRDAGRFTRWILTWRPRMLRLIRRRWRVLAQARLAIARHPVCPLSSLAGRSPAGTRPKFQLCCQPCSSL